eukprot:g41197.t1
MTMRHWRIICQKRGMQHCSHFGEQWLKESKHPVLWDAGGALYWSKPDADKPNYAGLCERMQELMQASELSERGKPRSGKSAKRPECANKPTHTGAECKVKETKTAVTDDIDDAWVGMAVEDNSYLANPPELVPCEPEFVNTGTADAQEAN